MREQRRVGWAALCTAALMVGLAGCGGSSNDGAKSDKAQTATSSTTSTTAEETSTTLSDEAVIRQFASEIAPSIRSYSEAYAAADGSCLLFPDQCGLDGKIRHMTVALAGETVGVNLERVQQDHMGTPSEIQDLVNDTVIASAEVKAAWSAVDGGDCFEVDTDECLQWLIRYQRATRKLSDAAASWGPYL